MACVRIGGKEYPLCLTVACIDDLAARGVGLSNILDLLNPQGTQPEWAENATWLLHVLMREGQANQRLTGDHPEPRPTPTPGELRHMLTPGQLMAAQTAMYLAIAEGMKQEIEAQSEKNGDGAA